MNLRPRLVPVAIVYMYTQLRVRCFFLGLCVALVVASTRLGSDRMVSDATFRNRTVTQPARFAVNERIYMDAVGHTGHPHCLVGVEES